MFTDPSCPRERAFSPARSVTSTRQGAISIRTRARKHCAQRTNILSAFSDFRGPWGLGTENAGVKVPDFTSHMPMLHSSRTFSLPRLIVERHEETSARLPKLVRASAAPLHPIHLSVASQTERDITSTFNLMYAWHGVRLACFVFDRANSIRPCEVEHASFTPLVFSASGGLAMEATYFYKRLASRLAEKRDQPYSCTMNWLRCLLSFSLLRSAIRCFRGARSSKGSWVIGPPIPTDLINSEALLTNPS